MVGIIYTLIGAVCNILLLLLVVRALSSWFLGMNNQGVYRISSICTSLTEFIVAPCRKIISRFNNGMFDWSVMLAFLVVILVRDISQRILISFFM